MQGIIVTDMYTDMNGAQDNSPYIELAYGVYVGGCDIPDGTAQDFQFDAYKPNGTSGNYAAMAQAMRLAAKRVCYSVAQSNAMNGISKGTRLVPVTPWWQTALTAAQIASGALLALTALWIIASLLKDKKKKA